MNDDLVKIQERIESLYGKNPTSSLGYSGPSLAGVASVDAGLESDPCKSMRWIRDNSDYSVEVFIMLSSKSGEQGVKIFNKSDGSEAACLCVPMGSSNFGNVADQIHHNIKTVIDDTVQFIEDGGSDFSILTASLKDKIGEGNPIGYGGGEVTLMSIGKSPCRALAWMTANSPYEFKSYARLSDEGGYQGFIVSQEDEDDVILESPMPDLDGGDPKNQIYRANRKFIFRGIRIIQEKISEGGW